MNTSGTDVRAAPSAPPAFHLLAKPTGAVCNLDCSYCFFLSKEMLYPGSRFRMADELLESYLAPADRGPRGSARGDDRLAGRRADPDGRSTSSAARSSSRRGTSRPGSGPSTRSRPTARCSTTSGRPSFASTTSWSGISIDGPRELHDAYRVNKGGKGSFDQVMRGLDHLRAAGVECNALTTVHAANADRGREVYRFLRDDCGARFIQFIPIIERVAEATADGTVPWTSWRDRPLYVQEGERVTGRSIGAEQYGRFLIDVFEEWVRRDVGTVYVQMFDVALANWVGEPPGLCVHSETCGLALALEHTGDLYSCDHFVEPAYRLGNITEHAHDRHGRLGPAARLRARQARHPAPVLPRVRRALRLPRRLPQGPLHLDARGRAGAQLPLRGLQALLPPRRRADARHGRAAAPGRCAVARSCATTRPPTPSGAATTRAPVAAAGSGSAAMVRAEPFPPPGADAPGGASVRPDPDYGFSSTPAEPVAPPTCRRAPPARASTSAAPGRRARRGWAASWRARADRRVRRAASSS